MASLKEVKTRINSVSSTRKITSAMKLVASSKLHKAQQAIESMFPYEMRLDAILARFVSVAGGELSSPYLEVRKPQHAVILAISSNSSLCGAFNSNIIKETEKTARRLQHEGVQVEVLTIGVKITEKMKKLGFPVSDSHASLLDHPSYDAASAIAESLMKRFAAKEIDQVIMVYNHFKNVASQVITNQTYLPIDLFNVELLASAADDQMALDYIIEPSSEEILTQLLPKVLRLRVYTALLDSIASEHSARVVAMQVATDNADELLNQLTLMYNKTRQAAITSELLDIVGASFQ